MRSQLALLQRELWEHRSIYVAPIVVALLMTLAALTGQVSVNGMEHIDMGIVGAADYPAWVAADMLSQAEHDPGAGIVVTDNADFAKKVLAELETQCAKLDRAEATKKCLLAYSGIVVCETMDAVIDWANDFAAEHLQVQCGEESKAISEKLINAGAIFIGPYTPVAVGERSFGAFKALMRND